MSQPKYTVHWNEDGSATCLARLTARNASGDAIPGEGYWIEQADVSSITCKVFDVTNNNTEITPAPTVTVASAIIDTPVTSGVIWTVDSTGYNFLFDVAYTFFPSGGTVYRIEFYAILTGGARFGWAYEGVAFSRAGG